MEKKTIGQFIAALRKASGMTQKQLSEKLNVSDKAVSRWERDECAPDLSLIPVIAEIFGVTSDEILRGERKFEADPVSENFASSAKSTKQMEHILKDSKLKFSIRSLIASGIAVVGLLGAMLCNFGFNRANIGFIVGCILFLAAAVCETIFVKLAFASVSDEAFEGDSLNLFKKSFFDEAYRTYVVIAVIFAATLPLSFLNAYLGLTAESWLIYGLLFGLIALLICGIVKIVANRVALRKGIFDLPEKEREKMRKLFKHDRKYLIILACVLLVTFIGQAVFNEFAYDLLAGPSYTFDSVDDFVEFMETPTDGPDEYYEPFGTVHIDVYGNEISDEKVYRTSFRGPNDELLATYANLNHSVSYYSVKWDEEGNPTINVRTYEDVRRSNAMFESFNQLFGFCYVAEVVIVSLVWFLKRRKI